MNAGQRALGCESRMSSGLEEWIPECEEDSSKGQCGDNWGHLNMDSRSDNSIVSVLKFLILITIFWRVGEVLLMAKEAITFAPT